MPRSKHYLSPDAFRFFAHRGLAVAADGSQIDENTSEAFHRALEVGATHIETDIQGSRDGVAMVAHDDDLFRIAGISKKVSELDAAELMSLPLKHGGRLVTLEQALTDFPTTKFNLDLKSENAIASTIDVVQRLGAQDRVLISSFSEERRKVALAGLPEVATSASAAGLLAVWLAWRLGAKHRLAHLLGAVDALQLPTHRGPIRFDSVNFIREVQKHGVELHYWTVNDPRLARVLRARGANGLVSDRIDNIIVALAE